MRARYVPHPTRALPRATAKVRHRFPRLGWCVIPFMYLTGIVCALLGGALFQLGQLGERLLGWAGADPFDL